MLDWGNIDTVLLDMDGTLLDLHFDTYFWLEHLPARYAETHALEPAQAREQLHDRIRRERGTLSWYCVDYWSEELGVDVAALKHEISHKVAFRPHVQDFLRTLKEQQIRSVIVTNAHRKSLDLKLAKTGLDQYVDRILVSHDFGLPKEDVQFWHQLQQVEPFDPRRTLLVDDSLPVLQSARDYGIAELLSIVQPDSQQAERQIDEFRAIRHFDEIKPEKKE
ncbi:GMP/IMP nucleotidase [Motiliproteus coralliicola]|uniref:GMP/IMP nucleotidase n=1 Tax=Motiliproteus coralliicola TaxID=2283196 RepID=A0A369WAJ6_9GAMM|nr:GMP/IMP nucleotidase [Motiliproteus coralliicola]RDE18199.1 GMP/IMP nucleotidase [Motiliproteus coralliicola]